MPFRLIIETANLGMKLCLTTECPFKRPQDLAPIR